MLKTATLRDRNCIIKVRNCFVHNLLLKIFTRSIDSPMPLAINNASMCTTKQPNPTRQSTFGSVKKDQRRKRVSNVLLETCCQSNIYLLTHHYLSCFEHAEHPNNLTPNNKPHATISHLLNQKLSNGVDKR